MAEYTSKFSPEVLAEERKQIDDCFLSLKFA